MDTEHWWNDIGSEIDKNIAPIMYLLLSIDIVSINRLFKIPNYAYQ